VTEKGVFERINDFATPSGWLLRRKTWDMLGPFDETIRFHVDTEFLGRVNAAGLRRIHLVEECATRRPWLDQVARFSLIMKTNRAAPLVTRTINSGGGMCLIARDSEAEAQSQQEHERIFRRFGTIPW
jgi:hypothetical protein